MSFASVRDQDVPVRLLTHILRSGRVPNGMLFWGPEGVGKRMAAVELAKAINCAESNDGACGVCLSCRKIAHGNHPDVKLIAPSGKTRIIKKETVDSVTELSAYRPFEGEWRVFIFDDAHRMNEAAQNHFLKTLEEPPSKTLFILVTPAHGMLLPTIRSRCQQVRFGALRPETVAALLREGHDLSEDTAMALASISQGQMSRALGLVRSEKRDVVLHILERLAKGEDPMLLSEEFAAHVSQCQAALRAAVKASAEDDDNEDEALDPEEVKQAQDALVEGLLRRELMEYLYLMQTWCRDELVYRAAQGDPHLLLNRDCADRIAHAARPGAGKRMQAVDKAWLYLERNIIMDRVFRDLFFALGPQAAS